ncbi:MAG TPA: hypothetical protein PKA06_12245 [Gemmatales bacterium]|nr:hypothetical protein [Gemmatales bacterium]HMP17333.1 hypothetical protein [Gemmatales bacterium]
MNFLRRWFGPEDPTRDWPKLQDAPVPMLDLNRPAWGTLVFGDKIEAAAFLGKPEKTILKPRCMEFIYRGWKLEFEDGVFEELSVYLRDEPDCPAVPELKFTSDMTLTHRTPHTEIIQHLGEHYDANSWEKYFILHYKFHSVVFEAEYDEDDLLLDRVTVYGI